MRLITFTTERPTTKYATPENDSVQRNNGRKESKREGNLG